MKKSKLLALGLIALVLVGGLALASCEEEPKCVGGGSSGGKGSCTYTYTYDYPIGFVTSYRDCNDQCVSIQITTGSADRGSNPDSYNYTCTCE